MAREMGLRKNGSEEEDEYCSSLANDETEESFDEIEEEEKGLVKSNIKKAGKLNHGVGIPGKRKSSCVDSDDFSGDEQRKRCKLSLKEKEDSDTGESDDEDSDEEFTSDELDSADDDEDLTLTKKVRLRVQEAVVTNVKKRKRNPKKPVKGCSSRNTCGKRRKTGKGRREKSIADSDPDILSPVEASGIFCTNSFPQRKQEERKGKEKVVDVGKQLQVCGICLSEEGKRTERGILNCCTHYFCFVCIMEWSKVESLCPLCKRRFLTIRSGRNNVVIPIPELDQVYQPSEEELRDNVVCSECDQGGDEELMLLCDLCESPAHTFCVGLGRQVPEGSWYCDACKPNAEFTSHDHVASNSLTIGESSSILETPTPQVTTSSPGYPSNTGSGAYTLLEIRQIQSRLEEFHEDVRRKKSEANDGMGSTMSPISRLEPDFKEQVVSMVKSHLTSLSRNMDMDLGYNDFKQIARTSTHTVLAAIGLEHRQNQDELLGLADSPDSDQIFTTHGLNMDVTYRTGETQQSILIFIVVLKVVKLRWNT